MAIADVKRTAHDLLKYLLAYIGWALASAAGILTVLWMRSTLNVVWPVLGGSRWVLRAVDRFGLVLLGLGWLLYALFLEEYYRRSISLGKSDRRQFGARRATIAQRIQESRAFGGLRRAKLHVLAYRFALTVGITLALLGATYLAQQLAFLALSG